MIALRQSFMTDVFSNSSGAVGGSGRLLERSYHWDEIIKSNHLARSIFNGVVRRWTSRDV
jgi:hypothetical protein